MKINPIQQLVNKSGQSVSFLSVFEICARRLRVEIKSASYDFQSHCRIKAWSNVAGAWELVADIPPESMKTKHGLAYEPKPATDEAFAADFAELVRVACFVLQLQTA